MHPRAKRLKLSISHKREALPLTVVADAAISTPNIADGRLVPLLILDASSRPDIGEAIKAHEFFQDGDVITQWGDGRKRGETVTLIFQFLRPIETVLLAEFDILSQGILVEAILTSGATYLQTGLPGDRFTADMDRPKILVEVGATGFRPIWDKLLFRALYGQLRGSGESRSKSKSEARAKAEFTRNLAATRFGDWCGTE